jgi:organic hydroperoxide reductase OsmC/OhrA
VAAPTPKRFEFETSLEADGRVVAKGVELRVPEEYAPEHLVLAALADCSLTSLRYHARRAGIRVEASAVARGVVTKREEDGRYAFVELEVEIDAELSEVPSEDLFAKAERDCFVGASFRVAPTYTWRTR